MMRPCGDTDLSEFVSVIICTYNRACLLERALHSLTHQTLAPEKYEIVVIDDGSTDNTRGVCARAAREKPNVKYLFAGRNKGLAAAANVGIAEAQGERVLFTDDDCIAHESWIERLSEALDDESIAAGSIMSETTNYTKLCHNIAQFHQFMSSKKDGPLEFMAGANMGFRRSVLETLNGFQESCKTPDTEIALRARTNGYRIGFAPEAVIVHDPARTTMLSIFRYASEHASETIVLRKRYRSLLHTPAVLASSVFVFLAAPLIALWVTLDIYGHNPKLARLFWTAPVVYALKLAWCWGAARGLYLQRRKGSFDGERLGQSKPQSTKG